MDWRDMLADIVRRQAAARSGPKPRSAEAVERFLETTVAPAFESLRTELARYGRAARIERAPGLAALTVLDEHGREEFYYAVRAQAYRRMSFAFPEFDLKDPDAKEQEVRAEVTLRSGPTAFDVTGYTQEQIIRQFLHEYRKWLGWRHGGGPRP